MTLVKGRVTHIEVAEDGSSVKLRLSDSNSVRLEIEDLTSFTGELVNAMVAAKANATSSPDGVPSRYEAMPLVIRAVDVNVNFFEVGNLYAISATDRRGTKAVIQLEAKHMRFLNEIYQGTMNPNSGQVVQ
jgi:hypothetical protein